MIPRSGFKRDSLSRALENPVAAPKNLTPAQRTERASKAGRAQWERRRHLRVAGLAEHIRLVVDAAPPLTDEQREQLVALLAGGARA